MGTGRAADGGEGARAIRTVLQGRLGRSITRSVYRKEEFLKIHRTARVHGLVKCITEVGAIYFIRAFLRGRCSAESIAAYTRTIFY